MKAKNQKNSVTKLISLIGIASTSVFLALPALALANSNSSSFDGSLNKRDRRVESTSTGRTGQLLAQGTSGSGGTGTGGTGTGGTSAGQTGTGTGGTGGTGTGGTGAGQGGTGRTGTGGTGTGGTGSTLR